MDSIDFPFNFLKRTGAGGWRDTSRNTELTVAFLEHYLQDVQHNTTDRTGNLEAFPVEKRFHVEVVSFQDMC